MKPEKEFSEQAPLDQEGDAGTEARSEKRLSKLPGNGSVTSQPPLDQADLGRLRKETYRKISLAALVALVTVGLALYAKWLGQAKSLEAAAALASAWLSGLTRKDAGGYALVFGPVALLLVVIVALIVRHGLPDLWRSAKQSTLAGLLFGGCLVAIGLLSAVDVSRLSGVWWLYFVPIVPPVLLAYQALVVWRQRPRSFGGFTIGVSRAAREALQNDGCWERYRKIYSQLLRVFGGSYDPADDESNRSLASLPNGSGAAYTPAYFVTHFAILLREFCRSALTSVRGKGKLDSSLACPGMSERRTIVSRRVAVRSLPGAAVLTSVALLRCDLPHGDDDLPDTNAPGVNRTAVLRLLAPQQARRAGAVVPITVEVTLAPSAPIVGYCVRIAGEPGRLAFPFGDACEPQDGGAANSRPLVLASTIFSQVHSCLRPSGAPSSEQSATLIAAYLPERQESSATLFGALYGNADCTGETLVSTAILLALSTATVPPSDAGTATSDAGQDPPLTPDASPPEEPDGGPVDGGTDADTDGGGA